MTAAPREAHLVELVDSGGVPLGSATVDDAHRSPGRLHRAFSVFLRDPQGHVLLQRRAATKTRFPLRWANSCCGHPEPGTDVAAAAARRLAEEIGVDGVELIEVGLYSYYAEDPDSGRVEYEFDHVLLGEMPVGLNPLPDPDEVADIRWVSVAELRLAVAAEPRDYAPWLPGVTERLAAHLDAGAARQHVGAVRHDADAIHHHAGATPHGLDADHLTAGAAHRVPGGAHHLPGVAPQGPGAAHRSPDAIDRGPGATPREPPASEWSGWPVRR